MALVGILRRLPLLVRYMYDSRLRPVFGSLTLSRRYRPIVFLLLEPVARRRRVADARLAALLRFILS